MPEAAAHQGPGPLKLGQRDLGRTMLSVTSELFREPRARTSRGQVLSLPHASLPVQVWA